MKTDVLIRMAKIVRDIANRIAALEGVLTTAAQQQQREENAIHVPLKAWVCPRCQRVYGPNWMACGPCNQRTITGSVIPLDDVERFLRYRAKDFCTETKTFVDDAIYELKLQFGTLNLEKTLRGREPK